MKAINLSGKHLGKRVRSLTYMSKNKTAKPRHSYSLVTGKSTIQEDEYVLDSIYLHKNGTILINGGTTYLRADTNITFLDYVPGDD